MKLVDTTLAWLSRICAWLAICAVAFTVIFYVAEVVARYGLNRPLNWAGDNGSYMLLITTFLILPQITRLRRHIAVTLLVDMMPEERAAPYNRILDFVAAAVLAVILSFVVELLIRQFHQGVMTPNANQIPRWWLTSVMTVGLALSFVNFLARPGQPGRLDQIEGH